MQSVPAPPALPGKGRAANILRMKALWRGQVIADSEAAIEIDRYTYFPRQSVRMELLRAAAKTASDRQCPHGVQFYDVVEGDTKSARAAWSYEVPQAKMMPVDHWIGFWEDVAIE